MLRVNILHLFPHQGEKQPPSFQWKQWWLPSAALFTSSSSSSLLLSALVPEVVMLVLPGAAVNQLLYPAARTPPALWWTARGCCRGEASGTLWSETSIKVTIEVIHKIMRTNVSEEHASRRPLKAFLALTRSLLNATVLLFSSKFSSNLPLNRSVTFPVCAVVSVFYGVKWPHPPV